MKGSSIGLVLAIACGDEQGFGEAKGENEEGGVGVLEVTTEITCDVLSLGQPKLGGLRIDNTDPEFGVRIEDIQIIDGGETIDEDGNTTSAFTNLVAAPETDEAPFTLEAGNHAEYGVTCLLFAPGSTSGTIRIQTTDYSQDTRGEFYVSMSTTYTASDTGI